MNYYKEIFELRNDSNDIQRGYHFEQLIREILPWSYRPPISIKTDHEQIDAFFEWNSWHFIVEAKAKKKPILAGSHDWEDYSLKLRHRNGQCIGLFFSLFDISEAIFKEAFFLNKQGFTNIIISGNIWDDLHNEKLALSEYLRYMVSFARSNFYSKPHSIKKVRQYCHDVEKTSNDIHLISSMASSIFLRRYKLIRHEDIYVNRSIYSDILNSINLLRPSLLSITSKTKRHKTKNYTQSRQCPKQCFLVKDLSGSGKTTLSVQIAIEHDAFFGISKSASQCNIDNLEEHLMKIGNNYGLHELSIANKPILYMIDSLDEASGIPNKHQEINAIFRFLEELNKTAILNGYIGFPILIGFSVRHDFWREWESIFEGRSISVFNKRFSHFTPLELNEAIKLYSSAYGYKFDKPIDNESKKVLSHPFNMQIFSEANEYKGIIPSTDILTENVLTLYFERKKEDIVRRPIQGLNGYLMMKLCGDIAKLANQQSKNSFSYNIVLEIIKNISPLLELSCDMILHLLISEQIIVRDTEDNSNLRFRHMRFIEYLVAFYIADKLNKERRPELLQELTDEIFSKKFVSIYHVHEFIRYICKTEFRDIYELLTDYYSKSSIYIKKLLTLETANIAYGEKTSNLQIDTILKSLERNDPAICWKGFFVLAAKNNIQPKEKILEAFKIAWETNKSSKDRWKLLLKMVAHKLELDETVLLPIFNSDRPKEWYILLEGIYNHRYQNEFKEILFQYDGDNIQEKLQEYPSYEWKRVLKVMNIILNNEIYDPSTII